MKLSEVVPWGRSFSEYREMFSLSDRDLKKTILGCGDGPACFNAELTRAGGAVVSADPIYRFDSEQLRSRIDAVYAEIMSQMESVKDDFVWKAIRSVDELGTVRMEAMTTFLEDFEAGKEERRYIHASLPDLPFEEGAFELALCSHYLFLYSDHVSREQHVLSMNELCRVASEVRVYPLLSIGNNAPSPHLESVMEALSDRGIRADLVPVDYEFQKGATQMLVAKRA